MLSRTGPKIEQHIPLLQAAYQRNRSTTEHVFTYKSLAKKAITSNNYEFHVLLMALSKDTIYQATLIEDLKRIVEKYEFHIMKILLENIEYTEMRKSFSEPFVTNTGYPQGNSFSAVFFIL
ncbi:hypothetical protein A3Q56_06921 [Intoshia linei]|uniref:Reverse transcriptase domain-containing protein n=1 Tax=Intoshia linei TaxID=1819745 RepID=A0A177AU64_9BILA|nr:hypothetical protein A3Q56_06921 [Intoshia linei]